MVVQIVRYIKTEGIINHIGYLGNKNLKKVGTVIEFTKDQVTEYMKCKEDIEYFCRTYMKIVNVDEGLVPFKLRDYQKKLIKHIQKNRFTITKCPRQSGKCFIINTIVTVRNKKTGEVQKLTISDLYESIKRKSRTKIL